MTRRRAEVDAQVRAMLSKLAEDEKPPRYLRIAHQYAAIQELAEAERYLHMYLQVKSDNYEAHKLLGDIYLKQNKYNEAYEAHKSAFGLQATSEVLAAICASAARISLDVGVRRDWLACVTKLNLPASDVLPLKEAILRQENPNSQDMEDVLIEQASLYPQDAESQAKLIAFYAEARRYENCVRAMLRVEGSQELRASPRWYKECLAVLSAIREQKALPLGASLVTLHLHVASRLAICLMTDSQLLSENPFEEQRSSSSTTNGSGSGTATDKHLRIEDFHRQLQEFDTLLHDALGINTWYREGQWAFVLEHFTGQLLFIFAMAMFRRVSLEDEVRDEGYRKRAQALMFAALEKRSIKIEAEQWFMKADEADRKLLQELYLDGCYRTATCYHCLNSASMSSPGEDFASRVKLAATGTKAIEMITSRMFPGRAIKDVYNQAVITRTCQQLPDRSQITSYEMNACVRMSGSLEHLAWFLVSGVDVPTERIFRTLPPVPDLEHGGYNPAQSDIDAFLSAVHAAIRIFGAKLNITKPTAPREVMQYAYTTQKQRKYWDVLHQRFVTKTSSVKGMVQVKKTLNDGLVFVRGGDGRDTRSTMPVWFMAQIARDQLKKAQKKSAYYTTAVYYYKRILAQLDERSSAPLATLNSGSRTAFSAMFELPKQYVFDSEETGRLRNEARIEIGKFLLHSGELEKSIKMLEEASHPRGYLYYARAVRKLSQQLIAEHDIETAELLKERARALLTRGIPLAKQDPELVEKLRRELDVYDMENRSTSYNHGSRLTLGSDAGTTGVSLLTAADNSLNLSALTPRVDPPVVAEFDFARMESIIKEQCDRVLADSAQRSAKIALELAELKAMQGQLVDSVAKVSASHTSTDSQIKLLSQTISEMKVKTSQLSQQFARLEEMTMLQQANQQDYHEYQDAQSHQNQQQSSDSQTATTTSLGQSSAISNYASGALVIPPGAGLPQFNLSSIQPPSQALPATVPTSAASSVTTAGGYLSGAASTQSYKALSTTPTATVVPQTNAIPKILFDSPGTIFERRQGQTSFAAVGGVYQITVLDSQYAAFPTSTKTLLYYNAVGTYLKQTLNSEVTARVFEVDGQTNLTWTYNGAEYYARFADLTCLPETLLRVFQNCGVTIIKSELSSSLASNVSHDSSKLYSSPTLVGGGVTSSPLQSMASLVNKTDPKASVSPATSTAAAPAAASSGFFSGSLSSTKPLFGSFATATTTSTAKNLSTFTFGTGAAASSTVADTPTSTKASETTPKVTSFSSATTPTAAASPAKDKTPEKAQTTPQTNAFAGFSFGIPKTDQNTPIFGAFSSVTTSSTLASTPAVSGSPSKPTFSFSTSGTVTATSGTPKTPFSFMGGTPTGTSTLSGVVGSPQGKDTKEEGDSVEEYEPTVHFQPVIELPDLVEVKTGEEGEDVIFCERAKLYRFASETKEWKERGLGDLKILRNKDTNKHRIVMRREQVLKLCANHQIIAGLKLQPRAKETEFMWAAPDFADGEVKNEQFVVRFKTAEQANRFKTAFEEGVKAASSSASPQKPAAATSTTTTTKGKDQTDESTTNLMDKFKPKPGSWSCPGCYMNNKASDATCPSCTTPKPGSTTSPAPVSSSPASSTSTGTQPTFTFGMPKTATSSAATTAAADSTTTSFKFGLSSSNFAPKFGFPASSATTGTTTSTTTSTSTPNSSDPSKTTSSPAKFSFGTPTISSSGGGTTTGFVFGQPTSGGPLATSPQKFTFGTPSGEEAKSDESKNDSTGGGFTFGGPQKHEFSFEARHASEDEDEVPESKDVYFAPVISLPPVVEVVTGEENQEVLYSHRARLYRFVSKEWKERGTGDFKLLKDPSTGRVRLTMRRDQVFKVCLNHYLSKELKFTRREDQRSIEWTAIDFAEGEPEPTLFALRVKTKEICDSLLDAITLAQSTATPSSGGTSTPTVKASQPDSSETKPKEQTTPKSAFSFKLEDHKDLTNQSPKSNEPKFGLSRNLFGGTSATSSADSEVTFVKEEKASPQDIARARELKLPDNFFLYESRDRKCKGCRGCDSDAAEEQATPVISFTTTANVASTAETKTPTTAAKKDVSPARPTPVFGAQSTFGLQAVVPANPTTAPKPLGSENAAGGGFVFGTSTGMSFATLAQTNQNVEFNFATSNNDTTWTGLGQQKSFFSAFQKKSGDDTAADETATGAADDGAEEEVEENTEVRFEPVIPLPELITVRTGEEDDEVLYSQRAKLYVYHPDTMEWKERAVGEAKVLRCNDGRARIVVRRDMVHKVACNHYITETMELKPMATTNNALTWSAVDFAEGEPTPTTFAMRVKGADRLDEFKRIFTEEVERAKRSANEASSTSRAPADDGKTDTAQENETASQENETASQENETASQEASEDAEEDDESLVYEASVLLSEEIPLGAASWKPVTDGKCTLRVIYDDDIFAHVILLLDERGDQTLAETVIAVQTSLREDGEHGIWMAQDISQNPSVRRRFRATFRSRAELLNFSKVFAEGKENAVECGIVETEDPVPIRSGRTQ